MDQNFVCSMMQFWTVMIKAIKKSHFDIKYLLTQSSMQYLAMTWNIIFSKKGNFGHVIIVIVHDHIVGLHGTFWILALF